MNWDTIKTHIKDIILIILSIIVLILIFSTTCTGVSNKQLSNNIHALQDSIQTYQLKNGEWMSEKQSYILEINQLEQYLGISKSEVRDLQKQLDDKIKYISRIESQVVYDTIILRDSGVTVENDTYKSTFSYRDEWTCIDGDITVSPQLSITRVNNIDINVPLKVGMSENNRFFVTTTNPYVNITNIESATIAKSNKKHYWSAGVQVGLGFQYGLINKTLDVGPYIGMGLGFGWTW